jgi:alpha,alpha-trehalose phosphorylase
MADTAGNLRDGVHVASAGGTWMALVYAFAGYRWRTRHPQFSPMLPTRARRVRFPLLIGGSMLDVDIEEDRVTYSVRSGDPVTAQHCGQEFTASRTSPVSFSGVFRTHDAGPRSASLERPRPGRQPASTST